MSWSTGDYLLRALRVTEFITCPIVRISWSVIPPCPPPAAVFWVHASRGCNTSQLPPACRVVQNQGFERDRQGVVRTVYYDQCQGIVFIVLSYVNVAAADALLYQGGLWVRMEEASRQEWIKLLNDYSPLDAQFIITNCYTRHAIHVVFALMDSRVYHICVRLHAINPKWLLFLLEPFVGI